MKFFLFPIVSIYLLTSVLFAQDSLDFLDKVNEKPKTVTKPKDEPITTVKKSSGTNTATVTNTGKKKKSKKKSTKQVLTQTEQIPVSNTSPTAEPKQVVEPKQNANLVEEDEIPVKQGMWIDSVSSVEPKGMPGFSGGLVSNVAKENSQAQTSGSSLPKEQSKPIFSFSGFFDKYKKAMIILGFIVLFAIYRFRSKGPSSNRSYRR
ncbi:SRP-less Sec system protein [Leptospira sp. 96542]|nr:SRP-less Sec system protein [Leptospira sp. 96542]